MDIIIKSIGKQYLLEEEEYEYLKARLNQPLPVMSIFCDPPERGLGVWHVAIYRDDKNPTEESRGLSFFIEGNDIEFEIVNIFAATHIRDRLKEVQEVQEVSLMCIRCNKEVVIEVPVEGFNKWFNDGMLIQDAMPEISLEAAEMLMSNICPNCWNAMAGEGPTGHEH